MATYRQAFEFKVQLGEKSASHANCTLHTDNMSFMTQTKKPAYTYIHNGILPVVNNLKCTLYCLSLAVFRGFSITFSLKTSACCCCKKELTKTCEIESNP